MGKTVEWSEKQTKQVTKFRQTVLTFLVQTHKVSVPVYEASQHISDILNYGDNVGNRHFCTDSYQRNYHTNGHQANGQCGGHQCSGDVGGRYILTPV